MRNRPLHSLFSLFLAALLLFGVLFTPAEALARAADPTAQTVTQFLQLNSSEQFVLGVDNNAYEHDSPPFGDSYFVSDDTLREALFTMKRDDSEYDYLMEYLFKKEWGGSCYGIAATMVLNRLTKDGFIPDCQGFTAAVLQQGAENYHDFDTLERYSMALDWLNF